MIRKITKFTKIAIISVILLVLTLAISVSLLYYFYPEDSVMQIIKSRAEILLNRKIDIGSLHYSPKGIVIYDVTIYDKDADNKDVVLVKADEVVITFSIFSVIKKDFKLRTIYLNGLFINCIFDKDKKSNIEYLIREVKEKTMKDGGEKSIQLSKIILNECRLKITNPPEFVKPLEGEYLLNSSINIKEKKTFIISNTRLTLPLKRGMLYPELTIETAGEFSVRGKIKLENASLLWVYKFPRKDPGLPFDVINGQINDFEITKDHVKGYAKATSTLKTTKSILSAEGSATVDLHQLTVSLKDIKGKLNSSSVNVDNMLISTKQGGIKQFSFSNIVFQLGDLRYLLHSLPAGLSGAVRGLFSFDGKAFNGKVDLSGISYYNKTELIRDLNTTIEINNNTIRKENIPATILGSSSLFSIATTDNNFKNFYISINSEKLNINNIQFKKDANAIQEETPLSENGTISSSKLNIPVNITGKISIKELVYDDLIFKNCKANISTAGNLIKINNADALILSGALFALGTLDISGSSPVLQTSLKFNNIKIHDIKFKNEKLNNRLFGFADGTANLNLQIRDNAAETIKGNATFTVTKGKVVNTGVQDGLIVFLSELRYKLKDLEFNKIYGNIEIAGNNFNINSFIFNSEDIRLSINGRIDKDLTAKDMNMKLEFNNHFIKDVPRPAVAVFNEYLSGKWYVIPFSLNGNITESKNMKMLKKSQ